MKRIRFITLILLSALVLAACQEPGVNILPELPSDWDTATWDTAKWE